MSAHQNHGDIAAGRLTDGEYRENFADIHPPLSPAQAVIEADRCYFCFDAPCVSACPTGIDIPLFIRQIAAGNLKGSAATIFKANIMGGMCARACPTETLCEEACVRNLHEKKPVQIGFLQRRATDYAMAENIQFFRRQEKSGRRIAIVGGGPAGLSCAHGLAARGHDAVVFESREKIGGLNEYGIAAYKTPDNFAAREVEYVLAIGGIAVKTGFRLGENISLSQLREEFDAVFLGIGLSGANALGVENEEMAGVADAVDFIANLRRSKNLAEIAVGRRVVIIGGGMTAIDAACQSMRLGAEESVIVYRRGPAEMGASEKERRFAQTAGVVIKHWAAPRRVIGENGRARAVEFERTMSGDDGKLRGTGDFFTLESDMIFKAVGQKLTPSPLMENGRDLLAIEGNRIAVNTERQTSLDDVWAGGDCVADGSDLTVVAVQDGKIAAESIDRRLRERM